MGWTFMLPLHLKQFKNKQNNSARLELKKYNPFLRRHTIHKEIR